MRHSLEMGPAEVKDTDFDRQIITVRSGKGGKDQTTLLRRGNGIRTAQTLFGHADVPGTQIYNHILGNAFAGVESPFG